MKETVKTGIILAVLFALLAVIMPHEGMQFDTGMWTNWAIYIKEYGLTNAYDNPAITYHPVYLYIIWGYSQLMDSNVAIMNNIHYLKLFTLVFDFLPVIVLCCFHKKLIKEKIPYLLLLLNIAYLYNTLIWGQIDAMHTSLCFLAMLLIFERPVLSMLLLVLAFNTKQQTIIFVPIYLILMLYHIKDVKKIVAMLLAGAALQALILLPFILAGTLDKLVYAVTHLVDYYHNVSIGAFNMWYLIFHDAYHTMDTTTFGFLSYKQIGLILFFTASGITLLPLLFRTIRIVKNKEKVDSDILQLIMISAGLISLYFFYFNTQMHERYAHPIILFFFFYGVFSKNYKLYILGSIPYFLSLEKCYPDFFPIPHPKIIFAMKVIAIWYTLTLVYGVWLFFREDGVRREWKALAKNQPIELP